MQNLRLLEKTLSDLCDSEHYLFSSSDISSLFPELSKNSLKALLSRAAKAGIIKRVCRGIYLFDQVEYTKGYELFHAASRLRAGHFNYISLETALSDEGVISQMLINRITIMSTGRKSEIDCRNFGKIEFIHTKKRLADIESRLTYDTRCRMWRADKTLAVEDLKAVGRNMDLIDYGVLNDKKNIDGLEDVFKETFLRKYDLPVEVRVPKESNSSVETWKLLVQTRPEQHLPAQRIHIDINSVPSSGLILKR